MMTWVTVRSATTPSAPVGSSIRVPSWSTGPWPTARSTSLRSGPMPSSGPAQPRFTCSACIATATSTPTPITSISCCARLPLPASAEPGSIFFTMGATCPPVRRSITSQPPKRCWPRSTTPTTPITGSHPAAAA
ncbi:UNVERIFIED_CONTAM: hypothetical protein GTU68_003429 [Idotea baltica]|nr:hypothetical protein [Idotea baltica]